MIVSLDSLKTVVLKFPLHTILYIKNPSQIRENFSHSKILHDTFIQAVIFIKKLP